jgi:hypothetical protein
MWTGIIIIPSPLISICGLPCTCSLYPRATSLLATTSNQFESIRKSPLLPTTMSNRAIPALGAIAAGGVGYYLYSAGGDPKLAEKKAERTLITMTERCI